MSNNMTDEMVTIGSRGDVTVSGRHLYLPVLVCTLRRRALRGKLLTLLSHADNNRHLLHPTAIFGRFLSAQLPMG